jgi:hypothetical protein
MNRSRRPSALAALAACAVFAACSPHTEKTAEQSVSPLVGTWTRDGNTPKSGGGNGPQFTKLTFTPDGSLSASYVAGGIGAAIGSSPSVKTESDTYKTPGGAKLSVAEGTTHLDYAYRVSGSKLYLTPSGSSDAAVFTKAD